MAVAPERKTGTPDVAPPKRSRTGSWGVWVGVAVIVGLILALFGFLLDGGVEEPDATVSPGVVLTDDPGNDLGN